MCSDNPISIVNASEHNLRSVSLSLPRNKLILVTGVSGSGKSSLIFDVLYREAESRYLGSFSSFARMFMGKMRTPDVERIDGLSPAIALDQKSAGSNPRSTVGTITGIYDLLRLLFARTGKAGPGTCNILINRSLFSFNNPSGACPACKGLGVEDFLDPELLIADPNRTLREGALVITAPNGYIIYSQVTLDVLDQVCRAEGFTTDIPWKDLTDAQKHIILFGSDKIDIPYGKHPLESRMKWSGITAKPREMGYYKGILPVMEAILKRDRNKNILRFVRTIPCRSCRGRRLNEAALSVTIGGRSIADLAAMPVDALAFSVKEILESPDHPEITKPVCDQILKQIGILKRLGLGYLTSDRSSETLSGGESQRLRLATQAALGLSGMICIFDEPSIGLHPSEITNLIGILKDIRDRGNTVIVVEHDLAFIAYADWLVDLGPGPGIQGGKVLYNGPVADLQKLPDETTRQSRTLSFYKGVESNAMPEEERPDVSSEGTGYLALHGITANNLKNIDVRFKLHDLNVVSGVSGAGKSTLTNLVLADLVRSHLEGIPAPQGICQSAQGLGQIRKLILIDQSPIGRTPRSNPATYTGLFDPVRDLFAMQATAIAMGLDKSHFSFNTEGGRCELCQGAGYQQVGMHFMGNVDIICERCEGRRFDDRILQVTYRGKSIAEVLDLSVSEALMFFTGEPKIIRYLETLDTLGLGYLTLGQRSSTLSGGEAQRIKLASELARPASSHTLYIMDEPTIGLHQADVGTLLKAIFRLTGQGHTVIVIEHEQAFIKAAGHVTDLGPGSGELGGYVVASGTPGEICKADHSLTGKALREFNIHKKSDSQSMPVMPDFLSLTGVTTHNLKNISVLIPHQQITVVTGVSGSGKSSLAFDTIHAESQNRFMEGFSSYVRAHAGMKEKPDAEAFQGLTPTLALDQSTNTSNPRSTVGTATGIYDLCRLLYSRTGTLSVGENSIPLTRPTSSLFSFNHQHGACPRCDGLGYVTCCDPEKLIAYPDKPILSGALDGTRTGKFYGDPFGQYMATIRAIGLHHGIDYSGPWNELTDEAKRLALQGTGDEMYDVTWEFKRDQRTGRHNFKGKWQGLLSLVEEEYTRKHADSRGDAMMNVMMVTGCPECGGSRLNPDALRYRVLGRSIADLSDLTVGEALTFFKIDGSGTQSPLHNQISSQLIYEIVRRLQVLADLGLSYLTTGRPFSSLSSGEARRVKLATQIGSGLTGITYVLDEPSAGLHPRDTARLMKHLVSLRDAGNTLVLVEHDRDVILAADHVVDLGPGAGSLGGSVIATGSPAEIMANPVSVTGRYLKQFTEHDRKPYESQGIKASEDMTGGQIPPADLKVPPQKSKPVAFLKIEGASVHNLKQFDLQIPMETLTVVTGVSGSGKSSLVNDLILASWVQGKPSGCRTISGLEHFSKVVGVERQTGFSSRNSAVGTYTGLLDSVRDIFAAQPESKTRGFTKNHFSFLSKQGQCPECDGSGVIRTAMDFLPDVINPCEVCGGSRFRSEILKVTYKNKDIAAISGMTVMEAAGFFAENSKIAEPIQLLSEIGLGYLTLGQSLFTLSGGEAQRLHLASELITKAKGPSLYLFDEPSTGLHFQDVDNLLKLFRRLVLQGNTLIIIEHDPYIVEHAGFLIELGPEGGMQGGYLMASSSR